MHAASRRTVKFFVSCFLVYAVFLHWIGWAEHAIFDSAKALVDEQRLILDSYADNNVDRLLINGHYYSNKPIGATLLAVPSYALWKGVYTLVFPKAFRDRDLASTTKFPSQHYPSVAVYDRLSVFERLGRVVVTLSSSTLLVVLTLWLIQRFCGALGAREGECILLAIACGFGTHVFFSATALFHDTMGLGFALWGFYLLFQAQTRRRLFLVCSAGMVTGFGVTLTHWNVLTLPAFLVYLVMGGQATRIPVFLLGSLIGVSPQLLYNAALTGNPLVPALIYHDPELWTTPVKYMLGFKFQPTNLIYILPQVLFLPSRGLFFYCPILILSVVGVCRMFKPHRAEAVTIVVLFVLFVLGNAFLESWWGGSFGSRYILCLVPFAILPLVYVVRQHRWVFSALLLYSVIINLSSFYLDTYAQLPIDDRAASYVSHLQRAKAGDAWHGVYREFLPRLRAQGPRSCLLDSLAREDDAFDLRPREASVMGFTPRDAIPVWTYPPIGFISVKLRYLAAFLLVVALSVLWARELSGWFREQLERLPA